MLYGHPDPRIMYAVKASTCHSQIYRQGSFPTKVSSLPSPQKILDIAAWPKYVNASTTKLDSLPPAECVVHAVCPKKI